MKQIALVALLAAVMQCSAQTNPVSVGEIKFKGMPFNDVAQYLAVLTGKPVVKSLNLVGMLDYECEPTTIERAFDGIKDELRARGCFLISVDDRYFRLVNVTETNRPSDVAHIEVELLPDSITVDGTPVSLTDVASVIKERRTSGEELWIHDISTRYASTQDTEAFKSLRSSLSDAGVKRQKIFRVYMREKS